MFFFPLFPPLTIAGNSGYCYVAFDLLGISRLCFPLLVKRANRFNPFFFCRQHIETTAPRHPKRSTAFNPFLAFLFDSIFPPFISLLENCKSFSFGTAICTPLGPGETVNPLSPGLPPFFWTQNLGLAFLVNGYDAAQFRLFFLILLVSPPHNPQKRYTWGGCPM